MRWLLVLMLNLGLALAPFSGQSFAHGSKVSRVGSMSHTADSNQSMAEPNSSILAEVTTDVHFTVRWLNYSGEYQLEIQSLTNFGTVTSLTWVPPTSLRVATIIDETGGSCTITSVGGLSCTTALRPPVCSEGTCHPAASAMTVDFNASLTNDSTGASFTDLFWGSYLEVTGIAPSPTFGDLPVCEKHEKATSKHLCVPD